MSRDSLAERQEEMRQRVIQMKLQKANGESKADVLEKQGRKKCIKCREKIARAGKLLCSRCTNLTNALRDTLPGTIMPPQPEPDEPESFFTSPKPEPDEQKIEEVELVLDNTKVYTRAQVAKMLKVSGTTLLRWENKGKIPMPSRNYKNQCIYTDELIQAARDFMNQSYIPPSPHGNNSGGNNSGGAAAVVRQPTPKISSRMERAVSSRIGTGRGLF